MVLPCCFHVTSVAHPWWVRSGYMVLPYFHSTPEYKEPLEYFFMENGPYIWVQSTSIALLDCKSMVST